MNISIAGGGRVGFHLARLLAAENHDVTVIELAQGRVEHVDYALDVSTIRGSASDVMVLQEAGVSNSDLFVSVTGVDEVNLVSAATAKGLGAKQVVARVDNPVYIESNILYETILGIDFLLSPNALTAMEITRYIERPGMIAAEDFGRGLVQVRQLRVMESPNNGQTLKELSLPSEVLLGTITREGRAMVPHGDSTIEKGDLITLVGKREQMDRVQKIFQAKEPKPERVMVMGGGSIGLHLAHMLEHDGRAVKVFDWDMERCKYLASQLPKTKVVCRDATSKEALQQEHVGDWDVFVATTHDDERNIMAAVLAKEQGISRTMCVVHQPDFASLVGKLGIDHAVTPRASLANRVMRLVHQASTTTSTVLEEGQIEIVEYDVTGKSPAIGKRLSELKLPRGVLVATIIRGEDVIVPRGESRIASGDSVICIASPETLGATKKLFLR